MRQRCLSVGRPGRSERSVRRCRHVSAEKLGSQILATEDLVKRRTSVLQGCQAFPFTLIGEKKSFPFYSSRFLAEPLTPVIKDRNRRTNRCLINRCASCVRGRDPGKLRLPEMARATASNTISVEDKGRWWAAGPVVGGAQRGAVREGAPPQIRVHARGVRVGKSFQGPGTPFPGAGTGSPSQTEMPLAKA